jgi:Xaa-Pro aminopeptidase
MTGTAVPTYSLAERDRRWNLARSFMDRAGLDALLVFGEHEDAGPAPFCFDTWFTNDRPGAIVVFPRTGVPTALVWHAADQAEYARRGGGDVLWMAPENRRLGHHDSTGVVGLLNEFGLAKATTGVVGLEPYLPFLPEGIVPYRLWSTVQAKLPDAEFRPVGLELARLMMPLSEEEIAVVRHSARIGDAMARAMVGAAGPGVAESEVYAAGMAAAHARGTVVPGLHLWTGPEALGMGPPPWAYRPQDPRVLQDGDMIKSEVFCGFGMRATQHQVTIAVGEVHEDFERAAAVARESYDAGLRALRPGRAFGEVVDEMRKPLEAAGSRLALPLIHTLNPIHAIGGGVLLTSAEMELEPGMTFALEPNCTFGHRRVTLGGTAIVSDDKAIELSPYTAQLLRAGTSASANGSPAARV